MRTPSIVLSTILLAAVSPHPAAGQAQNPSPMVETTRAHDRLAPRELEGTVRTFAGPGGRDVSVFVPRDVRPRQPVTAVVHFHGSAWLPHQAVDGLQRNAVSVVVNLGAGSTTYDRAFADHAAFATLLDSVGGVLSQTLRTTTHVDRVVLTAFSAGHGAVRAILRDSTHPRRIDAVLLLDGLHTGYEPDGRVLADSGRLDERNLTAIRDFAAAAVAGHRRLLLTHSEIFPGTFASTTETADWLLAQLGVRRTPVLEWGPLGMQQVSAARAGHFELLGYAGNSAPDHVDHLHALPAMLRRLLH